MSGGGQKIVQCALVLSSKGAAEPSQRGLFLQEGLGNGRKGAAHQSMVHRLRANAGRS